MSVVKEPSSAATPQDSPSMVEDLIDAMLNGGINKGLHKFVNICFTLLFIFLLCLGALWGLNIHVIFMLMLCTGLMLSINWFVSVMMEVQEEEKLKAKRDKLEQALGTDAKKEQ